MLTGHQTSAGDRCSVCMAFGDVGRHHHGSWIHVLCKPNGLHGTYTTLVAQIDSTQHPILSLQVIINQKEEMAGFT